MPQLNTAPWLTMMLTTWLAINMIQTLINTPHQTPTPKTISPPQNTPTWTWPW
uniref:ATP synthase complex subunit 8 n=1 Tax=Rieppeleon kerstenii TaxID=338557 RepID=D6RS26_9SAUR|nr:ATPase subunit 8 [Rieppeleon kerstenii]